MVINMRTIEEAKKFVEQEVCRVFHAISHSHKYPRIEYVKVYSWYGSTNRDKWRIKFSEPFIAANKDDDYILQQLVRHEVCHLFVDGHKAAFKTICKSIGCDLSGARCELDYNRPEERFVATCACGNKITKMQIPKIQYICKACGTKLKFEPNPLYNQF